MNDPEFDHETDDGPTLDDLNRFGRDTGYCPHCGEEVYDQAVFCPKCRQAIEGDVRSHRNVSIEFNAKMIAVVVFVLILAILAWIVF